MDQNRADELASKLEKGRLKTSGIFNSLTPEQWKKVVYHDPPWQVRQLLAHFVSSERQLLALTRNIAEGGPGAPLDLDIDRFNAEEQTRLEGRSPPVLVDLLDEARQQTIAWVRSLSLDQLEMIGRHPVLGDVTVETMILSIYGHQLLHMRDLTKLLGSVV
jgi:hypothetical protein